MKKLIITLLALITILGWGLFFRQEIFDFYLNLKTELPEIEEELREGQAVIKEQVKEEALLPPPLRTERESPEAFLTKEGVIEETNRQREGIGLPPLKENSLLDLSAQAKAEEMFTKQYFSHYSPEGEGVGDLAKEAGYDFILIGENLALGSFQNDQALVDGWMESSGHRENILNSRYQEIGVAVKKGVFEGKTTWMAVQHFGLPISACPQPNEELKAGIEIKEKEIEGLSKTLESLQLEIRTFRPKRSQAFQEKIETYNNLVASYNALAEEIKSLVETYNQQVELFNQCVAGS